MSGRNNLIVAGCLSFLLATSSLAAAQDKTPEADHQPLPPEEFIIADQELFNQLQDLDNFFRELISYIEIADEFGLDAGIVRPWVRTDDYWDTYWDITKTVKLRFDEEGLSIPYSQRDVHIKEQKPT